MKIQRLIFYICIILSIFVIYKLNYKNKINYVSLGDSLAEGINSYNEISYGYTDYIAQYLKENNRLNTYVNAYTSRGYKINNIIDDIENNKNTTFNNKKINIRNILRESNLVTISIGANDFLDLISIDDLDKTKKDASKIKNNIDFIFKQLDNMIVLIKKYAKGKIIMVGYYNPYQYNTLYKEDIDSIVDYIDEKYKYICEKNNIVFVSISKLFDNRLDYLPNPNNIHPNSLGYKKIFEEIKKYIIIKN